MTTLSLLDADALASSSVTAGEPTWLVERRRIAARRFADQAWPDSRFDEFWRSTPFDVRFDVEREIATAAAGAPSAPAGVLS